jgi:hypothetical protein
MRFHSLSVLYQMANRANFFIRDYSRVAAPCYQHVNARRGHDVEPPLQPTAEKNVAGKQRQQQLLVSVLPPVGGGVEGKKELESLIRQSMRDGLLMLVEVKMGSVQEFVLAKLD